MTETPRSGAATTATSQAGPDVLSELLAVVRLSGSVFINALFTAPFCVVSPKYFDPVAPDSDRRQASVLHLIVEGDCTLEMPNGVTREIHAGDLLFLPLADSHRFRRGTPDRAVDAGEVIQDGPIEGMWIVDHGGGGAPLRMVCGFVESAELLFAPVFRTLPSLVVESTSGDVVGGLLASTVREILGLVDAATPGSQAILGRLMELLFVETLRRHVSRLPAGEHGWFGALNDPVVGRALQLIHLDPSRQCTIDLLAREVGSSRTVLGERFRALLGRPPIDYVTTWRIQLAGERLRLGHESIAQVAVSAGYESVTSFSRAFRRLTGQSPGQWRERNARPGPNGPPLRPMPSEAI
ncbi:MAG: AraC family transcriptional regulator [Devosia sp.]